MYRRILVALDGSEDAQQALERAIELARGLQAQKLGLVNVVSTQEYWLSGLGYEGGADLWSRIYEDLQASARNLLADAERQVREQLPDLEVVSHALTGSVAPSIIQVAREEPYDLLVMGSRGMGRAAGLLLGSVSQTVVANLPCSVLIVRKEDKEDHEDNETS